MRHARAFDIQVIAQCIPMYFTTLVRAFRKTRTEKNVNTQATVNEL